MSKASEYAEASKVAQDIRPIFSLALGQSTRVWFMVDAVGRLTIEGETFSAEEALKLRDWLTETFDEVSPPSEKTALSAAIDDEITAE